LNQLRLLSTAVSHIPQFGDAASPAGDIDVTAGNAHLQISVYVTLLFIYILDSIKNQLVVYHAVLMV